MKTWRCGFLAVAVALAWTLSPARLQADCSLTTTGYVPLSDLGPGTYKGSFGGLYPGGTSIRPPAQEAAGLAAAAQIQPLDSTGQPDAAQGTIVFTSIGMSNVTQEWDIDGPTAFMPRANLDPSKSSKVTLVDGAQSGKDATVWADPNSEVWGVLAGRLETAGVTQAQVQVAWFEEAIAHPEPLGFPASAQKLQGYLEAILRNLKAFFPNLRIVYLTSRDRAYTDDQTALSPEPYAYENGFSVKWTITDQINGTGNLNFDPAKGAVVAPFITWGPYTWTDGTNPRSDGFTWRCSDLENDFIHPSAAGSGKIADQLLAFFKTDPTATPWFLNASSVDTALLTAGAAPASGAPGATFQFAASASGFAIRIVSYQWTFDDGTFSDLQNPVKTFPVAGDYIAHLTATDAAGNHSTTNVHVAVAAGGGSGDPLAGPLLNVATRGEVGGGDSVLIGGFIISGQGTTRLLLRAIGPSLTQAGVSGALADPTLELHNASGAIIARNDNWQTTELGGVITSDQVTAIRNSGIPPSDARESAIVANLSPGLYTAITRGVNNSSGVGLTEIYDLDTAPNPALVNISTRGNVLTADQVLIGGFIVGGPDPTRVLIRALGPSLAGAGVSNALADPTLELHDANGVLLQANDDWAESQKAEIEATGAAPTSAREAAILQVLEPGNYTATVVGKDGGTGIGLVEVYKLP